MVRGVNASGKLGRVWLVVLAAVALVSPVSHGAHSSRLSSCGFVSFGAAQTDDGVSVMAHRLPCREARREVRRWFRPSGKGPRARGWRCAETAEMRTRCTKGSRVIVYVTGG